MPKPTDRNRPEPEDLTHRSRAIDHFTDREKPIEAFKRHISAPEGTILPILHFWGVGGAGKSLLLEKLTRTEFDPPLPWALVDFHHEGQRQMVPALVQLKCALERNHHLSFPEFDLIWAVLVEQQGGAEVGLVQQFTPGTNMAIAAVEAIAAAPLSAAQAGAQSIFDLVRSRHPKVEEWVRKAGGTQRVLELRQYDRERLLSLLLRAFAEELAANAPARGECACRAVLFLDTYEKLWENTEGPTSPQGRDRDRWVRELYSELLNDNRVLLVIAGRDYLCWPDVDDGWREDRDRGDLCKYLDAHLLGGLSAEDTQRYLSRCKVGHSPEVGAPTPLQEAIIQCSSDGDVDKNGCLPFYVGLCANIVINERNRPGGQGVDPPPEWFQGIPDNKVAERLANRFLMSLPGLADRSLVEALSVPRWFDRALVRAECGGDEHRADAAWERLEDYSFTEAAGQGRLRFHAIMREALHHILEHGAPDRLSGLHLKFREHWQARFEAGEADAEVEAWYHHLHLDPKAAFQSWRAHARQAKEERDATRGRALISWWDGVDITGANWQDRMGDEDWASTVYNIAYWLDELRPFAWAHAEICLQMISCYEAALRVYAEDGSPSDWAMTQNNLGIAYSDLPTGDRGANLARAIECYEAALRVYTEDGSPLQWAMTQHNLGIAYRNLPTGDRGANLARAISCYESALRVRREAGSPLGWASTSYNLALAYRAVGQYDVGCGVLVGVVDAQPRNARSIYLLACLLALLGRADEALDRLAQAISLDPATYRAWARDDEDFISLNEDPRFEALIAEPDAE